MLRERLGNSSFRVVDADDGACAGTGNERTHVAGAAPEVHDPLAVPFNHREHRSPLFGHGALLQPKLRIVITLAFPVDGIEIPLQVHVLLHSRILNSEQSVKGGLVPPWIVDHDPLQAGMVGWAPPTRGA
jgi:hypothetical protein